MEKNYGKKCTICNGSGIVNEDLCPKCEGLGVPLRSALEDQYEAAAELDGTYIYTDEKDRHIDFEEEDYEV